MFFAAGSLHMFNGLADPAVWAALAFVAFLALLYYKKVHRTVFDALDNRAEGIQNEINQARKLKEEAQTILADYQQKQQNADQDAQEIIEQAKREAQAFETESKASLADMLERRMKSAETKIAQSELQAMNEIKQLSAKIAVLGAEKMLRENANGDMNKALVDSAIAELETS